MLSDMFICYTSNIGSGTMCEPTAGPLTKAEMESEPEILDWSAPR